MSPAPESSALTELVISLMQTLQIPLTPVEVSKKLGQPVKLVKDVLQEMRQSGLAAAYKETYVLTDKGKVAGLYSAKEARAA